MTEPRELPRPGADGADGEGRPGSPRRFARLVGSPSGRRLALPRLVGVAGAGLVALGLGWMGLARLSRSVVDWVDARPEHRIAFAEIRLEPAPPAWIRAGAAGILHRVRAEARRDERLSVPAVDLAGLETDFRRCPWVEDIPRPGVVRSHGRLTVHLAYRKPVAVADPGGAPAVVIDKDGVILPADDIDWAQEGPKFRARGVPEPLLMIRDVPPPASDRPGLPWRPAASSGSLGERDLQVLGAARLAGFLQGRSRATPAGRAAPDFVSIRPDPESLRYFLYDADGHCVFWAEAPGGEPLGEPAAAEKWSMLLDWVDRRGPLRERLPDYWKFGRSGLEVVAGRPSRPGRSGRD